MVKESDAHDNKKLLRDLDEQLNCDNNLHIRSLQQRSARHLVKRRSFVNDEMCGLVSLGKN